jgi:hypothetical protein
MRRFAAAALIAAALAVAGTAAAAVAPTVTTGPVTTLGPTSATVSGSVNPNGVATTWFVEYGKTTSYGSQTASTSAGSGTSSVPVSPTLTSLSPGTTYHYRVVATSSAGTSRGSDGLLTTSAAPVVVTGSASSVTATSATLNGNVNPSSRATTWYFEYGTSTNYGTKTAAKDAGAGTSGVDVSAAITGLGAGKTYHFRLVAASDAGTSLGSDKTFVASAAPVVMTKTASSVGDTTARLNGTVNPNGQSTSTYFEYGTTTSYGTKTSSKSAGSGSSTASISVSISGLAPGTVYHVRLVATNANGTTNGADVTFATTGPPIVHTNPPTGVTTTAATLAGSVDPNGHSTSWYFQYGTSAAYGGKTSTQGAGSSSGAKNVAAPIAGLTAGTTYHFRLVAASSAGTVYSPDAVFATVGPAATLVTSSATSVYSHRVMLSGAVSNRRGDEKVTLYAQRYGSGSFASVTTVLTASDGRWTFAVHPTITTTYKAIWNGSPSATVTIGVRPAVSLRTLPGLHFATHVTAAKRLSGRVVQLQRRLADGTWRTVARARLGSGSSATFHPALPRGRSTLRVAMSVNQIGSGYLAGFSPAVSVRRR